MLIGTNTGVLLHVTYPLANIGSDAPWDAISHWLVDSHPDYHTEGTHTLYSIPLVHTPWLAGRRDTPDVSCAVTTSDGLPKQGIHDDNT